MGRGSRWGEEVLKNPGFGGFNANQHLAGLARVPEKKPCPENWLPAQRDGKC